MVIILKCRYFFLVFVFNYINKKTDFFCYKIDPNRFLNILNTTNNNTFHQPTL